MKLNFPRITRQINIAQYAEGFEGYITVWVNPPRDFLTRFAEATQNRDDQTALYDCLVEAWSQGAEGTKWTAEEVREMAESSSSTDPQFFAWCVIQTMELIKEHRTTIKKV